MPRSPSSLAGKPAASPSLLPVKSVSNPASTAVAIWRTKWPSHLAEGQTNLDRKNRKRARDSFLSGFKRPLGNGDPIIVVVIVIDPWLIDGFDRSTKDDTGRSDGNP